VVKDNWRATRSENLDQLDVCAENVESQSVRRRVVCSPVAHT